MTIEIIPMKSRHVASAIELVNAVIPQDSIADRERPDTAFRAAMWANFPLVGSAIKLAASWLEGVNTSHLDYFVATDTSNSNAVVGVSGIYQINSFYLPKYNGIKEQAATVKLDDEKHFYLSWTGVSSEIRGKDVGTKLVAASVGKALEIAEQKGESGNWFLVLADHEAVGFYEKLGMKKVATLGDGTPILGAELRELAMKLDAKAPEGRGIPKDLGNAREEQLTNSPLPWQFP